MYRVVDKEDHDIRKMTPFWRRLKDNIQPVVMSAEGGESPSSMKVGVKNV